jgi:hypothetical protein
MESESNEPVTRGKKQRARVAEDEREKEKRGVGSGDLFEEAARESAGVLASEIVEVNVAESEKSDKREEEKEQEPGAQGREAQRRGWWSGVHGREVWRETAGETRRKDGETVRISLRRIGMDAWGG